MSTKKKTIDIITGSNIIKKIVKKRIVDELGLSYSKIISNAKEDGINGLNKANLSKYFSKNIPVSGSISQRSLLYLCIRYGIQIKTTGNLLPFNEEECRNRAIKMFSETNQ